MYSERFQTGTGCTANNNNNTLLELLQGALTGARAKSSTNHEVTTSTHDNSQGAHFSNFLVTTLPRFCCFKKCFTSPEDSIKRYSSQLYQLTKQNNLFCWREPTHLFFGFSLISGPTKFLGKFWKRDPRYTPLTTHF